MSAQVSSPHSTSRRRLRDLVPSLQLGRYLPGPLNGITDVSGVLVHTESIRKSNGIDGETGRKVHAVNTGVTVILPRKEWFREGCYAGMFRFNGSGEMTGSHWLAETGLLHSPIVLTNSFAVGPCYTGIYEYAIREYVAPGKTAGFFLLPVVGETYDGHLNDIAALSVTSDMTIRGIAQASKAAVPEGNTGGGTGMMCSGFKAGTGTASRIVNGTKRGEGGQEEKVEFTVGALVQTNFGKKDDLTVCGIPIGRLHNESRLPAPVPTQPPHKEGSIIVVIATSAPLHPLQLQRLAKRATVGVARLGGWGGNTSGDIFLAFSTGAAIPRESDRSIWSSTTGQGSPVVFDTTINSIFEAAADVVEEAIYNSLCMAESMEGPEGRKAEAIELDWLKETMERHHVDAPYTGGR
ncbi:peptidase family T4 [Naematelia encephala]|uniref:Peptidase family T4 n=1 Tax=Naematelia encephala TaxID=71784 RepID=A0A1Y2B7Q3_9TREE|nr:peptidase family T4 [Naematelia encephala]